MPRAPSIQMSSMQMHQLEPPLALGRLPSVAHLVVLLSRQKRSVTRLGTQLL